MTTWRFHPDKIRQKGGAVRDATIEEQTLLVLTQILGELQAQNYGSARPMGPIVPELAPRVDYRP